MSSSARLLLPLAVAAAGCSLVNAPSDHTQAPTVDAGPVDAGPDDGGRPPIAASELCLRYAEAFCDAVGRCCDAVDAPPPSCVGDLTRTCQEQLGEALTDQRIGYDAARAAEGLAEALGLLEACDVGIQEWAGRRDGLFRPFVGTVAGGESCDPLAAGGPGQVEALVMCEVPSQSCRDVGGERSCLARGEAGDACGFRAQCAGPLRCVRPDGASILTPASCGRGEPDGSPCIASDECASLNCVDAGWFREGTCRPLERQAVYCVGV